LSENSSNLAWIGFYELFLIILFTIFSRRLK